MELVVISDNLEQYFDEKIRKNALLCLRLPILVDVDKIYNPSVNREKTIAYTGTLTQHKDGVLTIIEKFC